MNGALGLFAKTIGLSPVKTRLAKAIGDTRASEFYALSVAAVRALAKESQQKSAYSLAPHWALAEAAAIHLDQWQDFPARWTGDGDLGMRLHRIYSGLLEVHDYVVLLGTDSPQLSPESVLSAIALLETYPEDGIVGPCPDGGFYLFAAKIPIPETVWTGVRYSEPTTLQALTAQLAKHRISVRLLSLQSDVDTVQDLLPLRESLALNRQRLPAQEALYHWLKKNSQ